MSTKLVEWNQSADCCSWEGVTCNDGRVIGLDLANEFITSGLDNSSSLFGLQHLERLSLANNDFSYSHEIPSEFDKLTNLSYLNLSNTGFAGQIPIAISRLTKLVTDDYNYELKLENPNLKVLVQNLLKLMELSLDGVLISTQGSLPEFPPNGSLQTMVLRGTSFSRILPFSIGNLKMLSTIDLSRSNFVGSILDSMASLTQLKYLDISYNTFSGLILGSMASLTQLKYLDISYNKFSGSFPTFSMCKSLAGVWLSNNYLPSEIISTQWEKLLNPQILDLRSNLLNGNIPDSLFSHPSLQMLDLSYNQFAGQLKEFSNASSFLEYLYLDNNHLEGPIPMSISELHGLEELFLGSNKFNNSLDLNVIQQLKNHSYLDLSHTSLPFKQPDSWGDINKHRTDNLNGTIPDAFLDNCGLQTLPLNQNQLGGLPKSLANCIDFEVLDIGNNHIKELNVTWRWLQIVDIASNNFTDNLQITLFSSSMAMMDREHHEVDVWPHYLQFSGNFSYQDMTTITSKGSKVELVKIPTIVNLLDFSCNNFDDHIPEKLENLHCYILSTCCIMLSQAKSQHL
ncbi:hypothetical protein FH972_002268 [Carpinus fangiana]|uniref:Leucine-rich repeat-containing N-terminal plant-type domain-containing protein n=1 Tax=Carpinus fangiana TaxID=176857 RepID=A0A5N6QHI5_9ROSI|nr:hypothetical protein FH972_002268 [Carpinus fangiana]